MMTLVAIVEFPFAAFGVYTIHQLGGFKWAKDQLVQFITKWRQ